MYLASLCKVLTRSDFNCDFYFLVIDGVNTIGVAIAGQRLRDVTHHEYFCIYSALEMILKHLIYTIFEFILL